MFGRIVATMGCAALSLAMFASTGTAGTPLTGVEIESLIKGKTFMGSAGEDIQFVKTYKADGTYELFFNDGMERKGTWWIDGDQYCQKRGEEDYCYTFEREDDSLNMMENGEIHSTLKLK